MLVISVMASCGGGEGVDLGDEELEVGGSQQMSQASLGACGTYKAPFTPEGPKLELSGLGVTNE